MSIIDKIQVGGTTYDIQDTALTQSVGEIRESLGDLPPSANLINPDGWEDGYYASGVWTESTTYTTGNYMPVSGETLYIHRFRASGTIADTSRYYQYIYWFDASQTYSSRTNCISGTSSYAIPTGAAYARVMTKITDLNNDRTNGMSHYVGISDTQTFVEYSEGGLPDYQAIVTAINGSISDINDDIAEIKAAAPVSTVALANNVFTIRTNHAVYAFQRVTDANKNIDTWRLYSGALTDGTTTFTMWSNSDAEGAIHISGETDFVGGYHGSEIMTGFSAFIDGVDVTGETAITERSFRTLEFYVESDVYHCYQDADVADTVAFKRCKVVTFSGDTVRISNDYIAQGAFNVVSARISLFQCYKAASGTPVFTNYSVNSDFKNYAVADIATTKPANSTRMTEATLNTTYGAIRFTSLYTSGQKYLGTVVDFPTQNRVKFYFDTITSSTAISAGDAIASQFEFTVM